MTPKIAIVILNWNGKHFLDKFLPALIAHTPPQTARIIIADNGSDDDSVPFLQERHPSLPLILLDKNYGYTGGYNKALAQIDAPYYILLNSDVEVTPHWLDPMLEFMETHPQCGVCMPKIISWTTPTHFEYAGASGGFIDRFGFPFCRGRILSYIEPDTKQYETPLPIFWASGTCMMVRSQLFHQLNGLDDHFFAHMEEIDFCWRAQRIGAGIWCIPQSHVLHVGGGTLPNNSPHKLFLNYRNNLFMLYKNLPNKQLFPIITLRMAIDLLSAIAYLVQGQISFTGAVLKAHHAFWRGRKNLERHLAAGEGVTTAPPSPKHANSIRGIYKGSIIFRFFIAFCHPKFSDLRSMNNA